MNTTATDETVTEETTAPAVEVTEEPTDLVLPPIPVPEPGEYPGWEPIAPTPLPVDSPRTEDWSAPAPAPYVIDSPRTAPVPVPAPLVVDSPRTTTETVPVVGVEVLAETGEPVAVDVLTVAVLLVVVGAGLVLARVRAAFR